MKDALFTKIDHSKARELRLLAYTMLVLVLNLVIIIVLGASSIGLAIFALIGTSVFIHALNFNRADFFVSCMSALITPLFDITANSFDLWHFTTQTMFGIPYWLPFMYFVSSLLLLRLKEVVEL
jgi:hypothetical protein